jgi:2-keto-4-pentenoate hydratase
MRADIEAIADQLIAAYDNAATLAPITAGHSDFDVAAGYDALRAIEARRMAGGWAPVGRKIGFTNRTIWPRYGVYLPMWAHVWSHTVHYATAGRATLALGPFVQPRIEPEVVFKLRAPVPVGADALAALDCVEWIAPGFEIVQSHFPDWKFTAADCTAAFGLHGALVIGTPLAVTDRNRAVLAALLPGFMLTLRRAGAMIDTGVGANVLDSPALALVHLAGVLAGQPQFPPLAVGEIVTTGTVTDAWPVAPGQTWTSDYGALGLPGVTLTFA